MAYMRIHCHQCGGTWEVYQRDNWKDDRARTCPHCFSEIDGQTWERQIIPALGAVADANAELQKDHTGTRGPLFTVDVLAGHGIPEEPEGRLCSIGEAIIDIFGR